ncbi:MAG: DNA-binding response regulator [Micavibrio sp.]|nr:MAG: DNA-binding response regulator [Micavibrio sp.]
MKLLLADDHTLFRDALVQYIERAEPESDITLAKNFYEVVDLMKEKPEQDLILLDLRMPGMNGMEGFKRMRDDYPDIPVALMSGVAETKDVNDAMDLGAVGYFPKTLSGKALLKAIQLVLTGERFVPIDHETNAIMPSHYNGKGNGESNGNGYGGLQEAQDTLDGESVIQLTPRETEVLSYLARGASNKEIARELELQVVTVKLHVRGVCRKLEAKNRTQAALKARELGIVAASS